MVLAKFLQQLVLPSTIMRISYYLPLLPGFRYPHFLSVLVHLSQHMLYPVIMYAQFFPQISSLISYVVIDYNLSYCKFKSQLTGYAAPLYQM